MRDDDSYAIYNAYAGFGTGMLMESVEDIETPENVPITKVNIYTKRDQSPIILSHTGRVISYNDLEEIVEISAVEEDTKEKIHVTIIGGNEIKVVVTHNGNVVNQFVGSNMTFSDEDDPSELNVMKIETV